MTSGSIDPKAPLSCLDILNADHLFACKSSRLPNIRMCISIASSPSPDSVGSVDDSVGSVDVSVGSVDDSVGSVDDLFGTLLGAISVFSDVFKKASIAGISN